MAQKQYDNEKVFEMVKETAQKDKRSISKEIEFILSSVLVIWCK